MKTIKTSLRCAPFSFLLFSLFVILLLCSILFLSACEQEKVPEAPVQKVVEGPFAQASDVDILQQHPDDLDEALKELDEVE